MIIKLIRHAPSQSNSGEVDAGLHGDKNIQLAADGTILAHKKGAKLGSQFFHNALVYCSPFLRCKQTLVGLMEGAGVFLNRHAVNKISVPKIYYDPRLREMEHGFNKDRNVIASEEDLRKIHGWFYYRFSGGESPADCYDRCSTFIESMQRQIQRKRTSKVLIVSHGITIRCFVMRWMHLTDEQYAEIANPHNCDIITIAPKNSLKYKPQFTSGQWGVSGLRFRSLVKSLGEQLAGV